MLVSRIGEFLMPSWLGVRGCTKCPTARKSNGSHFNVSCGNSDWPDRDDTGFRKFETKCSQPLRTACRAPGEGDELCFEYHQ